MANLGWSIRFFSEFSLLLSADWLKLISELPELDFDLELTTTILPMTISLPATTSVSSTTTSLLTKSIQFKSMDLETNHTLTPNDLNPVTPDLSTRRSQTLPNSGYTVIPGEILNH